MLPFDIIDFTIDVHLPFVRDSWIRSWSDQDVGDPYVGMLVTGDVFRTYRNLIGRLLIEDSTTTLVATPHDQPDDLIAWISGSNRTLFYIYVKAAQRHAGIARLLVEQLELRVGNLQRYCFWTSSGARLCYKLGLTFDPGVLRAVKKQHTQPSEPVVEPKYPRAKEPV